MPGGAIPSAEFYLPIHPNPPNPVANKATMSSTHSTIPKELLNWTRPLFNDDDSAELLRDYTCLCQLLDRVQFLSLPRTTSNPSFPTAAELFRSNQDRGRHREEEGLDPIGKIKLLAITNNQLLERLTRIRDILNNAFNELE